MRERALYGLPVVYLMLCRVLSCPVRDNNLCNLAAACISWRRVVAHTQAHVHT